MPQLARLVQTVVNLAEKVVDDPQPDAVQLGDGGYADRVYVGVLVLRERTTETYDEVVDRIKTAPLLRAALGIDGDPAGPPAGSTVCEAANRLSSAFWRTVLALTTTLFSLSGVCAIDASGFGRSLASRRYERRSGYRMQSLKTTLLVDVESLAILDVHCSTGKPHDTQIGWQVIKRNRDNPALNVLLGDKGYDWDDLRQRCREADIRPVIKHREFSSLDRAHNARLDDDLYAQRSQVETVFSVLKRRFGKTVRARTWFGQFREMLCRCVAYNVDRALNARNATPSGV